MTEPINKNERHPALLANMAELCQMSGISKATGYRLQKSGQLPVPSLRAGRVVRWSTAELARWSRGRNKPHTPDRLEALVHILRLMGLEREHLTHWGELALLDRFHSVPYPHRGDPEALATYLELTLKSLQAFSRAETMVTVAESDHLIEILEAIKNVLKTLRP